MHIDHLSDVYELIQGQGAQIVVGNGVGGGSNLYLAASLRSPRETFERRDRRPGDGPDRRMWPRADLAPLARPVLRARRAGAARATGRRWKQVSKSGGLWARDAATPPGHTCDRVPLAIDPEPLRERQVVPHRLRLRREEHASITNYLAERRAARRAGARRTSRSSPCASARRGPYRYVVTRRCASASRRDRRDRVQGADPGRGRDGQRADPHALAPDAARAVGASSASTSASTATTSRRSSTTRKRVRERARPARLRATSTRASRSPR